MSARITALLCTCCAVQPSRSNHPCHLACAGTICGICALSQPLARDLLYSGRQLKGPEPGIGSGLACWMTSSAGLVLHAGVSHQAACAGLCLPAQRIPAGDVGRRPQAHCGAPQPHARRAVRAGTIEAAVHISTRCREVQSHRLSERRESRTCVRRSSSGICIRVLQGKCPPRISWFSSRAYQQPDQGAHAS